MKHNWEYKKLGDVCDYPNQRIAIKDLCVGEYVGVENLVKNRGGLIRSTVMPDADNSIEFHIADVLIGNIRPYLRKIWLADFNGGASGDVIVLRVKKEFENKLQPSYLYKVLSSEKFFEYDNSNTKGAKMPRGDRKSIAKFLIPIPPLSEQSRIVAELDLLTGIIDKQNAQLKELDNLAQSIFYDMFGDPIENEKGWDVKKLGEVCSLITDGVHAKPVYVEDGVPFISVKDITTGKLLFDDVKYVSSSDHATMSKRCPVAKGDILYTKVGATYGRPALVDTDKEFSLYVSVALLKPKQDLVDNVFLCHQMATDFVKHQADKSIKGIGVPDLHLNMIRNFRILIPPKSLQLVFNSKIACIENQKAKIKASIVETQKLLDYTMDKYFG